MEDKIKNLCTEVSVPLESIKRIAENPDMTDSAAAALGLIATYAVGVADALCAIREQKDAKKEKEE